MKTVQANVGGYKVTLTKTVDEGEAFYSLIFTEPHDWSPQSFELRGLDDDQVELISDKIFSLLVDLRD